MSSPGLDGSEFADPEVVAAYNHRPPIPDEIYQHLLTLIPISSPTLLDAGCGTGAIARRLSPHVVRADAIDPSPAMIHAGRTYATTTTITWHVAAIEDAELHAPYGLIVCADPRQPDHRRERAR